MPAAKAPAETAAIMWKPIIIRALIAAIFGLTTVFLQDFGLPVLKYGLAAYFVFSGSGLWEYLRRDPVPEKMRGPLSIAAALFMAGAIALLFAGTEFVAGIIAAVALIGSGLAEFVAWLQYRKAFVPARDQLYTGAVGALSGVGLLLFLHLDAHGLLGIVGGGAIIIAVLLAISGFGFRHDAGPAALAAQKDEGPRAPRS
ncbi:hypothetical protein GCM10010977_08300 [Citricoccus zhacaiensis]|uniref:DUF308 domain-containing protein n=1 Tax=Citricoccus zhacaiensis TaxID=489142 RepID=A0ABQ2LRY7_9MICC|nr:hypothetical protein [Citricoccus zhacaiensis]GGO42451.1 hypothetical protein GCM10010977_08300 [Citricoccus zhacaiensis]